MVKALGEEGDSKALDSDNPWRELKWLGNQVRPPFMLIKPSELQAQMGKRAKDKPVGQKKHKQHRLTVVSTGLCHKLVHPSRVPFHLPTLIRE